MNEYIYKIIWYTIYYILYICIYNHEVKMLRKKTLSATKMELRLSVCYYTILYIINNIV